MYSEAPLAVEASRQELLELLGGHPITTDLEPLSGAVAGSRSLVFWDSVELSIVGNSTST